MRLPAPRAALLAALLVSVAAAAADTPRAHRDAFGRLPGPAEILYLPDRYAACLPCHPRGVYEDEDFNVDTGFRDTVLGKNLHWMHVFRQPQGTNCSACHRPPEGDGAVGFAGDAGVTVTAEGGSCRPACHRDKTYRNAYRSGR